MTTPHTIRALIDARAAQCPDKPFLLAAPECAEDGGAVLRPDVLTFAELRDDCRALETVFQEAGLQAGDVVSVFMGNGIHTARLLLAAMYSGLVANPLNLLCQPSQLRYIVEHSDTRMVFVSGETHAAMSGAIAELREQGLTRDIALLRTSPDADGAPVPTSVEPVLAETAVSLDVHAKPAQRVSRVTYEAHAKHTDAWDTEAPSSGDPAASDVALLMYTSGTTGAPKGVLLDQRNLLANARNISREHRLGTGDRVFAALPLYHINGLVVTLLAPLFHGGSVVMAPRFSARTYWRDVARHGCTWINVVPTIVAYLLNNDEPCTADLSALRFCRSASAALPVEHHRAFEARFGIGIIETMGMTETAAPMFSNPYDPASRRIGSIGLPSGGEAKVIDRDGRECAADECGELVLRGEQVMRGYYKRAGETRAAFTADGWLRTGDLGYRDSDGYFYINGRAKELIIKGGENIAPREIDEALLKHPGVLDAAVVGVPDSAYGQEIVAFIVPRISEGPGALDIADLREHCLRELGRYKTPKEFRFIAELPRGPSGKVQRLKLVPT
ncbi:MULTISPECIES: AMP-binding protein [Paraburkholderia]|uniref:AMP-binding protein n=1 Tax=Paraburkholderia TaxID=1822464 RepID=UPI002250AB6A|nr:MULTISPECIES: AMP-binding protein [Paraburkholderia]MCX4158167.1 AMP-binding protein [Paraburkholderia aspalathi]MDN7167569.1 AMP-binding protein [Paraburkholderia sp. SECH2]MDQ6396057.1 AMP-binding protein [Paraburkholderia aspalathi]